MPKIGDRTAMAIFTVVGLGTLASILLTSQVKKVAVGQQPKQASFDERMAALEKRP